MARFTGRIFLLNIRLLETQKILRVQEKLSRAGNRTGLLNIRARYFGKKNETPSLLVARINAESYQDRRTANQVFLSWRNFFLFLAIVPAIILSERKTKTSIVLRSEYLHFNQK